eukprot:Gregarina_sp_Poly_1__711@NODE_116_length_13672_cov_23_062992_g103_i0_p1_GENE_NODE_116_length_13672_cov_23_062992_g103_i0NODE_116_length_13672_cov_23_062992_g103_i0_p1_ORF_typecomplete_len1558_score275_82_NODE_116_length_13672_cov_23_062992_g103_i0806112734
MEMFSQTSLMDKTDDPKVGFFSPPMTSRTVSKNRSQLSLSLTLRNVLYGGHGFPVKCSPFISRHINSHLLKFLALDDRGPCAVCIVDKLGGFTPEKSPDLQHEVYSKLGEIFYALKYVEENEEYEKVEKFFSNLHYIGQLIVKTQSELLTPIFGKHVIANALVYLASTQIPSSMEFNLSDLMQKARVRKARVITGTEASSRQCSGATLLSPECSVGAGLAEILTENRGQSMVELNRWQRYLKYAAQVKALKSIPRSMRAAASVQGPKNMVIKAAGDRCEFNLLLKQVHLDLLEEFHRMYLKLFLKGFDLSKLKTRVNAFYDTDYIQFIQWKVRTLLSSQFPIHPQELHPLTRLLLEPDCRDPVTKRRKAPPTAYLVLKDLRRFRFSIVHDTSVLTSSANDNASLIKQLLHVLDSAIFTQRTSEQQELKQTIQATILFRILLNARILQESDFKEVQIPLKSANWGTEPRRSLDQSRGGFFKILEPKSPAAAQFYRRLISSLLGVELARTSSSEPLLRELVRTTAGAKKVTEAPEQFRATRQRNLPLTLDDSSGTVGRTTDESLAPYFAVAEHLVTNYLWLDAFEFLITLQGISWEEDDFPFDPINFTHEQNPQREGIAERNIRRAEEIFRQLSYNTGFMSASLADEGVLLLTEGRLSFSAVVACLALVGMTHTGSGPLDDSSGSRSLTFSSDGSINPSAEWKSSLQGTDSPMEIFQNTRLALNREAQTLTFVLNESQGTSVSASHDSAAKLKRRNTMRTVTGGTALADPAVPEHDPASTETTAHHTPLTLDWTWYQLNHGWGPLQLDAYNKLAGSTGNFIGKTQLIEFFEWFRRVFLGDVELQTASQVEIRRLTANFTVDFTFFDQICKALGFSDSVVESRQYWALVYVQLMLHERDRAWWKRVVPDRDPTGTRESQPSTVPRSSLAPTPSAGSPASHSRVSSPSLVKQPTRASLLSFGDVERPSSTTSDSASLIDLLGVPDSLEFLDDGIPQLLPLGLTARALLRLFLLPINSAGVLVSFDDSFDSVTGYVGCAPPILLTKLLMAAKIGILAQGFCCIWENLPKVSVEVTEILTPEIKRRLYRLFVAQSVVAEMRANKTAPTRGPEDTQLDQYRFFIKNLSHPILDARHGKFVSLPDLKFDLPKFLLQGMWPEAVQSFFELGMNRSLPVHNLLELCLSWGYVSGKLLQHQTLSHWSLLEPYGVFKLSCLSFFNFESKALRGLTPNSMSQILERMNLSVHPVELHGWLHSKEGQDHTPRPVVYNGQLSPSVCERHASHRATAWVSNVSRSTHATSGSEYCAVILSTARTRSSGRITLCQFQRGLAGLVTDGITALITESTGLSYVHQTRQIILSVLLLLALFAFFGFAASAFSGLNSFTATLIQSLLAVGGAMGFQSGLTRDKAEIRRDIIRRMSVIFKADLETILTTQSGDAKLKPAMSPSEKLPTAIFLERKLGLAYRVPEKNLNDRTDAFYTVVLNKGDSVSFEPMLDTHGFFIPRHTLEVCYTLKFPHTQTFTFLQWITFPPLPLSTGLTVNKESGKKIGRQFSVLMQEYFKAQ